MGGTTGMIVMGLIVVVVLVFIIVSSITGKKARKKEQEKRKRVVKDEIKAYLAKVKNQKNISVDYEKVFARKGPEYRYRDIFDVVVRILSPKDGSVLETKSFEIEGITTKVSKKEYKTDWIVNKETDLDETQKNIAIAEKKIKLSKAEQKEIKQRNREIVRDQKVQDQTKYEAQRKEAKEFKKDKSTLKMHEKKLEANHKATKFILDVINNYVLFYLVYF
jgi:type VI protein secretion system component VasK